MSNSEELIGTTECLAL